MGNAPRAAHQARPRPEMGSPWAASAPHLAEAALCRRLRRWLLAVARVQQPHDSEESDEHAPVAAHHRSPPTALGPRYRPWLLRAGRAPAKEARARPAPRSALRPPRSRLPCGRAAARAFALASLRRPPSSTPRSRTRLRYTWPAARPAQRRGLPGSGSGYSPDPTPEPQGPGPTPPCPPRLRAHTGPFLSHLEEIKPGLRVHRALAGKAKRMLEFISRSTAAHTM